jgi:DNA-binding CsgD family transcriptional regulator
MPQGRQHQPHRGGDEDRQRQAPPRFLGALGFGLAAAAFLPLPPLLGRPGLEAVFWLDVPPSSDPSSAAPITGGVDPSEVEFSHAMRVQRIHESPRVTLPFRDEEWQQIVALGARAYLSKATSAADLPAIIRHVAAGATMLPPAARRRPGADLTVREVEVLGLAAQGISNAELGRLLFVSERTIKFHLRNVFLKLGATNRTEAAHVALMRGLIG